MAAHTDTGLLNWRLYVAFVIIEDDVAITVIVESDFGAVDLSAKVVGIAKHALGVGAIAGKLQLDGAGFAEAILQIAASGVERLRAAERD